VAALIAVVVVLISSYRRREQLLAGHSDHAGIFIIPVVSLNLASGFTGVFSLDTSDLALGAYVSPRCSAAGSQASYLPNLPDGCSVHLDLMVGCFHWVFWRLSSRLLISWLRWSWAQCSCGCPGTLSL
jgi:ABC-type branched-subunit amino acid transport system permease subunit